MKKILVFVTVLILTAAMLLSPAGAECNHCDENGAKLTLVKRNVRQARVGVPGYSGDWCCPRCGVVIKPGKELPALDLSSGPSDGMTEKPETQPPATEQPRATEKPEATAKPEEPVKPEQPAKTEKPEKTKKPKEKATEKPPKVVKTPRSGEPEKTTKPTVQPKNGSKKKKTDEKPQWEPFSRDYPFRRIRMKPKKGIRAGAAGTPVWPAASPFQGMIGE